MISRKDNILKRPYEERRFENHRRKVKSALPAIDNRSPDNRYHVHLKSKKQLQERDRLDKIQRNNFLLLQKLKDIRRKCNVDHYWRNPLPQMVKNKVALFNTCMPDIIDFDMHDENDNEMEEIERRLEALGIRKTKCNACTPRKQIEPKIPEERIPWEIEKDIIMKRERSKSLPPSRTDLPTIKESNQAERTRETHYRRVKSCVSTDVDQKRLNNEPFRKKRLSSSSPRRIVLSRGCLKLSVNFPVDTLVTFQDGAQNKLLTGGLCHCRKNLAISGAV